MPFSRQYLYPATTSDLYDTRWLYKSDFVKIKNVMLGYNIPINKKFASKLRTYFSIQNLYTWDKYDGGFSPEASTYGSKKTGYDFLSDGTGLYIRSEYGILIQCRI